MNCIKYHILCFFTGEQFVWYFADNFTVDVTEDGAEIHYRFFTAHSEHNNPNTSKYRGCSVMSPFVYLFSFSENIAVVCDLVLSV